MSNVLSNDDRIATIAACSTMGRLERPSGREEPLGPAEWSDVAQWLHERGLTPADLLALPSELDHYPELKPKLASRLIDLPSRAALVALELERFENRGIWSLVRFDEAYPLRWKEKLKNLAPPVLFGAGAVELMNQTPSVAIVGSRDIDQGLTEVATSIGQLASRSGYLVVSGGARGSDRWGMFGALDAGRAAVGILHGDLAKDAGKQDTRQYLEDGKLCLTAHVHPATGFVTGNAMARNRYIHSLVDATVVIATAEGSGGTWQGSKDNLERRWSPLLVWNGRNAPAGNNALLNAGGIPIADMPTDESIFHGLIETAVAEFAARQASPDPPVQTGLPL